MNAWANLLLVGRPNIFLAEELHLLRLPRGGDRRLHHQPARDARPPVRQAEGGRVGARGGEEVHAIAAR